MVLITEKNNDHTLLITFLQKLEFLDIEERRAILKIIKAIYEYDKVPIEEEWVNLKDKKK